jgi:hypothetical protein
MLLPQSYNRVQSDPHKVWFVCECGWKTRKRTPGKPPKAVLLERPFCCPKCNKQLSDMTVVR